jgi:hypothetical protein
MREFVARVFPMRRRLSLAAAVLLAGCHSAEYELYLEQQEKFASNGTDSSGDAEPTTAGDTAASTGTIGSDSAADTTDTADATDTAPQSGTGTDTGDASDTADSPPMANRTSRRSSRSSCRRTSTPPAPWRSPSRPSTPDRCTSRLMAPTRAS